MLLLALALAPQSFAQPSQLDPTTTQVSAGGSHGCALTAAGGVKCWGDNIYGQLGDGTTTNRSTPVGVSSLTTGVIVIATGDSHSCALTAAGGVKCWGANTNGQLGDGSTATRLTPVDVSGLAGGVAAIAAGDNHTCALTAAGGVKCWGQNSAGQLGDGSTVPRLTAVDVVGLTGGVASITTGGSHTCALTATGGVKCWGSNGSGQLGDGSSTNRSTPVDVNGLASGVSAIDAGRSHSCVLTAAGGVKCWGYNAFGQLGDGSTATRLTPVDVSGLAGGVAAIAAGAYHSCGLTTAGGVKCWGNNVYGALGDGSTTTRLTPFDVSGLASGVSAIAVGTYRTCALTATGGVKCWGNNGFGALGDGSTTNRLTPVNVGGLASGVAAIAAGGNHTCALTPQGGVKCWGSNAAGELGDGSTTNRATPVDVSGLASGVAVIAAGGNHTCALTAAGGVKCWGSNNNGQLGDGSTTRRLTPVDIISGLPSVVTAIAAGLSHTCALTAAGGVKCWGYNYTGQLGDGGTAQRLTPVDVIGLTSGVAAIAAGGSHTCALTTTGGVKCWGYNAGGQLGDGSNTTTSTPVDANGLTSGVSAIALGLEHTCALTAGGGVKCWGYNNFAQLGDGSTDTRLTPVDVSGLTSGVSTLSSGRFFTCVRTAAGSAKCWGSNSNGQIGDGSTTDRSAPTDVSALSSGVTRMATGYFHACALTAAGGIKCWGSNVNGQIGDGSTTQRLTQVDVLRGQSINFTPPALSGATPVTLTATSSSGLPVSFDTWTPTTCTVSGNTVTALAPALCGIRASQTGDGNNAAAPQKLLLVNIVPTLNVDLSGAATRYHALSDGLMVLRFMNGLSGVPLTAGAGVPGASVTDPSLIAGSLAVMGMLLDIDGNGSIDAATDGLLIVRYMLGLRGNALIADALGPAPRARSTAADIEAWLAGLMP